MAPPAKKGSSKAPAAAPAAAAAASKKENKPPAAAKASGKAPAPAPAAGKAASKTPAPAPAATKKAAPAEKKPAAPAAAAAEAKPAAAPEAKKAKEAKAAPAKKAPKKTPAPPKKKAATTTALKGKGSVGGKKKKIANRFVIDCTLPAEDQLFNCADFEKFLRERIKVSGKTSNFGGNLHIERGEKNKLAVNASIPFSKRYLKYLTKKYLKKNLLRDTLRVIATSKDGYELRYFQIGNEADEEEDAE